VQIFREVFCGWQVVCSAMVFVGSLRWSPSSRLSDGCCCCGSGNFACGRWIIAHWWRCWIVVYCWWCCRWGPLLGQRFIVRWDDVYIGVMVYCCVCCCVCFRWQMVWLNVESPHFCPCLFSSESVENGYSVFVVDFDVDCSEGHCTSCVAESAHAEQEESTQE
jgi:hypothetical protein